jgi:nifR3 family TIM-barrel protein
MKGDFVLKIGELNLKNGIFLAPMAGYTDRAMRLIARENLCEFTTTEMVSAKAVTYGDKKTFALGRIYEDEGPVALQLFGSEPAVFAEAGGIILHHESEEIKRGNTLPEGTKIALPVAFDINMGCPVNKIFSNGEGSALMRNPDLIFNITRALKDATPLPVTVKMRLGVDSGHINILECAKAAEEGGASAICIHGRTRVQMYGGEACYDKIREAKSILKIPVIANGDITSAESAIRALNETGADGIAIGRGAVGNPFIFREIVSALLGEGYAEPSLDEKIEAALRQLRYAIEDKGAAVAIPEARKQIALYIRGFRGAARIRAEINMATTYEDVKKALLIAKESE